MPSTPIPPSLRQISRGNSFLPSISCAIGASSFVAKARTVSRIASAVSSSPRSSAVTLMRPLPPGKSPLPERAFCRSEGAAPRSSQAGQALGHAVEQAVEEALAAGYLLQGDELVGLVRLADRARAADH